MDREDPFPFGNIRGGEEEFEEDEGSNLNFGLYFGSPRTRQSSPASAYPEYYGGLNNESYYGNGGYDCYGYGYEDYGKTHNEPSESFTLKFEGLSLKDRAVPEATNPYKFDQANANLHKLNVLEKERQRRATVSSDLVYEGQHIPMYSQAKANANTYAKANPCQYSPLSSLSNINSANDIRNLSEKISTRPHDTSWLRYLRHNCIANYQSTSIGNKNGRTVFNGYSYETPFLGGFKPPELKLESVGVARGRIYYLAKDKSGCHILKSMLKEDCPEDVEMIFIEIIDHIVELMTDPFGNIVVQELLGVCNEEQRVGILHAITGEPGELIRVSCNAHGCRVVQKMIQTLRTIEQVRIVASSLMPGIVSLMKHTNGSHVVQCCLRCFSPEHCKFIVSAAILHCAELGSDSRGCCVLQKCLEKSEGGQRNRLIYAICFNSYFLSQDPYGNYAVQSMLDLGIPQATAAVIDRLKGSYRILAMQVHGSNVVEKCLNLACEECRAKIVHEFIRGPFFLEIAKDKYGNYVIQTALKVCKGALLRELVAAIRCHRSALRCNKYGNKVVECLFSS